MANQFDGSHVAIRLVIKASPGIEQIVVQGHLLDYYTGGLAPLRSFGPAEIND